MFNRNQWSGWTMAAARLGQATDRIFAAQAGRLVPWVALAAIGGAASYIGWRGEPPGWVAPLVGLGGAGLVWRPGFLWRYGAGLLLIGFAAGFAAAAWQVARAPPFFLVPRFVVSVTGRVEALTPRGERMALLLGAATLDGVAVGPRTLRVVLRAGDPGFPAGARIGVPARLFPPALPAIPGGRDPRFAAFLSGLGASGYAVGRSVLLAPPPPRPGPVLWLATRRQAIAARVQAALPGPRGAIAAILLTGEGGALPSADRAAFRAAGLSHLLAIAGLHVAIVMGIFGLVMRFLLLCSEYLTLRLPVRQLAALAGLGGGLGYLLLTGGHLPTRRSLIMATILVLGLVSGRRAVSLRSWGLAALLLVLVDPGAVVGPGFQMSFAAVLALIAGYQAATPWLRFGAGRAGWWLRHVAGLMLTSLLAGTACLPFIAYHFNVVQPYFVLANLVAVPLIAVLVLPAGLLALGLMPVRLAGLPLWLMGQGIGVILGLARWIATLPMADLPALLMPPAALALSALALAVLCLWRGPGRSVSVPLLLLAGLVWHRARPPDLLIAADGRSLALVAPGRISVAAAYGSDPFTQHVWQEWLGAPQRVPSACPGGRCAVLPAPDGPHFAAADPGCAALFWLGSTPCPGVRHWNLADSRAQGAAMVWFGPPLRLVTDAALRGLRPWTRPVPPAPPSRRPSPGGAVLPLARAEIMPPMPAALIADPNPD